MKLSQKTNETNVVTTKKDKTPWWIAILAEMVFFFLLAYTRAKREQEERNK